MDATKPTKPTLRKVDKRSGPQVWLDVPLDGGWMASYRLLPQDGRLDVAEVRVAPAGGDRAAVPRGGVSSRKLRELKVESHRNSIPELQRRVDRLLGTTTKRRRKRPLTKEQAAQPRRPGRAKRDPVFLARVAARYSGLVEDGSRHPIPDLTAELKKQGQEFSVDSVRGFIVTARKQGLLTPAVRGRAGGDITPKAEALLADARSIGRKWKGVHTR